MLYPGLDDLDPSTGALKGPTHQQNGQTAVGAVTAVAIAQHRSPQRHTPRPQRDHSNTASAHRTTGLNQDYLAVVLWYFNMRNQPVFSLKTILLLARRGDNVNK